MRYEEYLLGRSEEQLLRVKEALELSKKRLWAIPTAFYECSRALDTWHYKRIVEYVKRGICPEEAILILVGRQMGANSLDPFVKFFFANAIMDETEIELMRKDIPVEE